MKQETTVTVMSAGTPFLDGFSTATASFLIVLLDGLSPETTACFTSFYYLGSLAGALAGGLLADRFGRKLLYLLSMAVVCTTALLAVIAPSIGVLLVMRLATGVALGGDYPVAQAVVTELVPKKQRARALSFLMLGWYIGACSGLLVAQPFLENLLPWQGILIVETVIAGLLLLGRCFIRESLDWKILRSKNGFQLKREKVVPENILMQWKWWRPFLFCCGFWLCQTVPATVLMLYGPTILRSLAQTDNTLMQMLLLYVFFLVGSSMGTLTYFSQRPQSVLIGTFLVMSLSLAGIVLSYPQYSLVSDVCFVLFSVSYGLQTPLDFIYPNLLFTTQVRASTVGAITAISRLGTAGAAFIFPLLASHYPIANLLSACAGVGVLGALIGWYGLPTDRSINMV